MCPITTYKELVEYALLRLQKCPFGEEKSTCQKCTVRCYKPEMRARICSVMRWLGPRMIVYHPIMAIRHLFAVVKY